MSLVFAFADSELAFAQAEGDALTLHFAAAAVARDGEAGWLPGLRLVLEGAHWTGDPAECLGRLRDGTLADAASRFSRLPLPFDGPGPWLADFGFAHDVHLHVDARHARVLLRADAPWRPSSAC